MAKKKVTGRGTEYNVTAEEFVAIWEASSSSQEVSERTGMPVPIVNARASKYRKSGVKLKKMRKGVPPSIQVDELNKIVDEVRATQGENGDMDLVALQSLLEEILSKLKKK